MENLQSQQYHSGCRSNRKTDIKSNISTNTTNWSKWSSLGICCMSFSCIYHSNYSIKKKYKTRFNICTICSKTNNCNSNNGNLLIFYIFSIKWNNNSKFGYNNSNNISSNHIWISNSSIKSIFKR